jgi:hypothetical protein
VPLAAGPSVARGVVQRACPPAPTGLGNTPAAAACDPPASTPGLPRFLFCVDSDEFATPAALAALEAEGLRLAATTGPVNVHGYASTDGPAGPYNFNLSCKRAQKARTVLIGQGVAAGRIHTFAHGGVTDLGTAPQNRSVVVEHVATPVPPPVPPPATTTRTYRIVAKSFIRVIGGTSGLIFCPTITDPLSTSANVLLRLLAFQTDRMFSETAPTDAKDGKYRLFSKLDLNVSCTPGSPPVVTVGGMDTDVGIEPVPVIGPLTPPPMLITGPTLTPLPSGATKFRWFGEGRPHLAAEPGFQAVCTRTSVYIWHDIEGEVDCSGVRITDFKGSGFPTHRVYVDGAPPARTIPQGPFKNLWIPDIPHIFRVH